MNERIYTLAEQTGATRWNDELNGNSIDFSPEQFEKFAELIVKECIQVGGPEDSYRDEWFEAKADSVSKIKQHFGVEE